MSEATHGMSGARWVTVVMAKAPLPGISKTRLQRETGLDGAAIARLAEAFLRDMLQAARELAEAGIRVHFAPADAEAVLRRIAPDVALFPQVEGDLGERMVAALASAFATGAERVVVVGTDAPQIDSTTLRAAFQSMERADCVLGPAEDGGYWAIGLRAPCPELFADIEWSTPHVLEQTLERGRVNGVSCVLLATDFDVDGATDLARLADRIARGEVRCTETARALAELGRASPDRQ